MSNTAIINQLNELRDEPETDEFGRLRASEHAFHVARRLMNDAGALAEAHGVAIPRGCASTDTEGGIRIDWLRPDAAVCLIVPASEGRETCVYHEVTGEYATDPATPEVLARWLREIL